MVGSPERNARAPGVYIHHGYVDVPIWPPEDDDLPPEDDDPHAGLPLLVLSLSPGEARDLAGLLTYAAGRVDEIAGDRCADCGIPLTDHPTHDEEEPIDGDD